MANYSKYKIKKYNIKVFSFKGFNSLLLSNEKKIVWFALKKLD